MANVRGAGGTYTEDAMRDGDFHTSHKHSKVVSSTYHSHFYGNQSEFGGAYTSEDSDEELDKRRKAQAELEREDAEAKRMVRNLMKMTPESRAIDNPAAADRVRGNRYEP